MRMPFSYIYNIARNIGLYHKYRILMTANIQTLSLPYGIELGPIVTSDDLSVRIVLISGLLYMLAAAAVCLGLEPDVIADRLGKLQELLIGKGGYLFLIEWTASR